MLAFKFLDAQGATLLSGSRWPLPTGAEPGPWVEAGSIRPCREGIHACRADDLAYWLNAELWEIELDGDVEDAHRKLVAQRGRLIRRLDAWSSGATQELSNWCAWRSRDVAVEVLRDVGEPSWADQLAEVVALPEVVRLGHLAAGSLGDATVGGMSAGLAGDAAELAPTAYLAAGPFVAACAAAHAGSRGASTEADHTAAFASERQEQSNWIVRRLRLA